MSATGAQLAVSVLITFVIGYLAISWLLLPDPPRDVLVRRISRGAVADRDGAAGGRSGVADLNRAGGAGRVTMAGMMEVAYMDILPGHEGVRGSIRASKGTWWRERPGFG